MLLSACAHVPTVLQSITASNATLSQVSQNIDYYKGVPIRWGGTIIDVENEIDFTRLQILYYPLNKSAQPQTYQTSEGRFVVITPTFLDPAVYKKNAEVSVTGLIKGVTSIAIGKKTLSVPVVDMQAIYLWPEENKNYSNYPPYFNYPYGRFNYPYYSPYYTPWWY
jgi:outer membrane lipoprotein